MKKTILIILAVLPIVLLVVIAIAGRFAALYQHIPVEGILIVDRMGGEYGDQVLKVPQDQTRQIFVRISPIEASNKKVFYTSQDEKICTIDENGLITGVHFGTTTVTAKTEDGGFLALLNIEVTADVPYAVELSNESLTLKVDEIFHLSAEVDAPVAVDKSVTYVSSDPSIVTVDPNGNLVALKKGEATISVITNLGNRTDTCTVTVEEGKLPIYFDFSEIDTLTKNNGKYIFSTNVINLKEALSTDGSVDLDSAKLVIRKGNEYASLDENGVLTISSEEKFITVRAYVGELESPSKYAEITLLFRADD